VSDYRRRRLQPDDDNKGGGGLPIFPLIVLVIFAGLLLGGVLAKFLGGGGRVSAPSPAPTFTPLPTEAAAATPGATRVAEASPSPLPSPSATPRPTPTPRATASAGAIATASVKPTPTSTPAATATASPTLAPTATPVPTPKPTVKVTREVTPQPTPTPSPALITGAATSDHAAAIVRSYLTALANGESSFATGYLRTGLPTEDFMKGGKVTNVQATANDDGSFFVTAEMTAQGGVYTENFRVVNGPQGLQITDHTPSVSH
jgi:hypothetical protein